VDSRDLLLIGSFLILPGLALLGGAWYLRKANERRSLPIYEYQLGSFRFRFTSLDIQKLTYLVFVFGWSHVFVPAALALLLVIFAASVIGISRKVSDATSDDSHKLIEKLGAVQNEIGGAQQHINTLSANILAKQTQVEKRERAKRELDELIRKKSEEAKGWNEQTEAQRQAFLETAVSAMSKGSRGTFWWGLVLGFALNLLATLTWTLLGNPGKDDILRKFEEVTHIFR